MPEMMTEMAMVMGELPVHHTRQTAQEAHGDEDGAQHQHNGDDRGRHFAHGFSRGLTGSQVLGFQHTGHIFHDHDGVVDHNADANTRANRVRVLMEKPRA